MKEIKDYLHLYLGCECIITPHNDGIPYVPDALNGYILTQLHRWSVKPILRPLSDMTDEEKCEYNQRKQRKGWMPGVHAENTVWLTSKGFDLFGLIDAGLAIDVTKFKSK